MSMYALLHNVVLTYEMFVVARARYRYVPQANRALRNFNMYLNVRQPPLRSKLPFNPFAFLFARPHSPPPVSPTSPTTPPPPPPRRRSPSPSPSPSRRSSSVPIQPIPPASNPRGELIFSSRVDRGFREPYDRYRAQFERRREEREWVAYGQTWQGWIHLKMPWTRRSGTPTGALEKGEKVGSGTATPVGSFRGLPGRGRMSGSPAGSRKSSPVPGTTRSGRRISGGLALGERSGKEGGGTPPGHAMQHPLASRLETVSAEEA